MDYSPAEIDLSPLAEKLHEFTPLARSGLLPALHAAQELYGYIPRQAAEAIGIALGVPLADVSGVIDFYALFHRDPVGKTMIHVCNDPVCAMAGADGVFKMIQENIQLDRLPTASVTLEHAPCLGLCEHAPALLLNNVQLGQADPTSIYETRQIKGTRPVGKVYREISILTRNCGRSWVTTLEEYETAGGYQALRKAMGLTSEQIRAEVKAAGLVGRGGAAFPTGLKWDSAAAAQGEPKYVICNADEAEPGTFKDRVILEEDPHLVLEGLAIAARAVGASKGYIFIRGEYSQAFRTVTKAVEEARGRGYLGGSSGLSIGFDIEIRRGAGAYICGEETALFEAIEGKRGFPRIQPPFPTTSGLFGQPTVINNVETLANIPYIIQAGATGYRQVGTEKSPGPKLFCVSGDVLRPGLYEVPFGITLGHLVNDLAGGVRDGRALQALLVGGAAGAFAGPQHMDVRLTFEDLRATGLPLGSGVVTVFNDQRDLRDVLVRLARFFADESCGKCYPCQMGTRRQQEILERLARGSPAPGDISRLEDIGWTMTDASLCGLGQTAASAVMSAYHLWPNLFDIPAGLPGVSSPAQP